MSKIRVVVAGALGRMGSMAIDTFLKNSNEFELIAGTVRDLSHIPNHILDEYASKQVKLTDNVDKLLDSRSVDVLVELTTPDSVFENSVAALKAGVRPVIGATGLHEEDIRELISLSHKNKTGTIIAPNFAIGAILMMKFAAEAAKYMDSCEIIELHHDQKIDAPSGTAIKTAKLIYETSGKTFADKGNELSRGEKHHGINIHSLRLKGLVAHQEVIFGSQGQSLTIRHDSLDRSSFMPGILLAARKVMQLDKLVYGLEKLI